MVRQSEDDLGRVRGYLRQGMIAERGRIPPERKLADDLGMTRSRLRRVLRKLSAEGVIWRRVGLGTFLGASPPPKAWSMLTVSQLTNPQEVLEARIALEPHLARMAASRATPQALAELQKCLDALATTSDPAEFIRLDRHFHKIVAKASGNTLMQALLDAIQASTDEGIMARLRDVLMTKERMHDVHAQHARLLALIRARDPVAAEREMLEHIRSVRERVFGSI